MTENPYESTDTSADAPNSGKKWPVKRLLSLILGTLAGLWTIGGVIGFARNWAGDFSTRGMTQFAAGVAVTAMGAAITWFFLKNAFRKQQEDSAPR